MKRIFTSVIEYIYEENFNAHIIMIVFLNECKERKLIKKSTDIIKYMLKIRETT